MKNLVLAGLLVSCLSAYAIDIEFPAGTGGPTNGITQSTADGRYVKQSAGVTTSVNGSGITNLGRVFYASKEGCALDANAISESGTDDMASIQAILDKALTGPTEVVIDGTAFISTNLIIHANTKLRFTQGSGLVLRSNACCPMITTDLKTNFTAHDIVIDGGIWYNFGTNQAALIGDVTKIHGDTPTTGYTNFPVCTMWLAGCSNVTIQNVQVQDPSSWGIEVNDSMNVTIRDCKVIDTWIGANGIPGTGGHDGFHFVGNVYNLNVFDCYYKGGSDGLALNFGETPSWGLPVDSRYTRGLTLSNLYVRGFTGEWNHAPANMNVVRVGWPFNNSANYYNIFIRDVRSVGSVSGLFVGTFRQTGIVDIDGVYMDPSVYADFTAENVNFGISADVCGALFVRNVQAFVHAGAGCLPFIISAGATNVFISNVEVNYDGATGHCCTLDVNAPNDGVNLFTNITAELVNVRQKKGDGVLDDYLGNQPLTRVNVANIFANVPLKNPTATITNIWRPTVTNYVGGL